MGLLWVKFSKMDKFVAIRIDAKLTSAARCAL